MCRVSDVQLARLEEPADVFATEAVSDATDLLAAERAAHLLEHRLDDGINIGRKVVLEPGHDVEVIRVVHLNWIALEEIRHDDEVAIGSELVGDAVDISIVTKVYIFGERTAAH
jgi:hypothetical protein